MNIVVLGAGPAGLTVGAAVARRGHHVQVIDRDPGPAPDGTWRRRGVMQFAHPHGFRPQVGALLRREWPEAWAAWLDLGAEPDDAGTVRSRRVTYERALRQAAPHVDRLTIRTGHVSDLIVRAGRVIGSTIDGASVGADVVIDATGRRSRFALPPTVGGDTGMSYVTRTYQHHPDAEPGPMTGPVAWYAALGGYDAYVFPHERPHFSAVLIRPTADIALRALHDVGAFAAACAAIPGLSTWTDPSVATPTSGVMIGGRLLDVYRPQARRPGLVSIGDAVATTAPTAGRGVAMASMQIHAFLELLDTGNDPTTIAEPFGAWCDTWILPWVEDHLATDAESIRRWQGQDLDLDKPLTSAAIIAAAQADPRIAHHAGGFLTMTALPSSLATIEPLARAAYQSGWRPARAHGPTRDELLALLRPAAHDQRHERLAFLTPRRNAEPPVPARAPAT